MRPKYSSYAAFCSFQTFLSGLINSNATDKQTDRRTDALPKEHICRGRIIIQICYRHKDRRYEQQDTLLHRFLFRKLSIPTIHWNCIKTFFIDRTS